MIRRPINRRWRFGLGIASVAVLLLGYAWLSGRVKDENPNDTTIPSWSQITNGVSRSLELGKRTEERWLVVDAVATGFRLFAGMFFGVGGAIILGLLMGCFGPLEAVLSPPLTLFAKVPGTAALAVFFVLVGTDTEMYIAMVTFGVLPSMALSVHLAVRDVPDEMLNKAYTLGASQVEIIWNVIVRHILPRLIDAVRLQIGPAMVYLIAAEMLVGDAGFGFRIRLQQRKLDMSVVYFYVALLAMFGFGMDYLLKTLQRLLCPWFNPAKQ